MTEQEMQKQVYNANARTYYYKRRVAELQKQIDELQELLDEKTTPGTNNISSTNELVLTKVSIAYRRSEKMNGALVPVNEEVYVAKDVTE